MADRVEFSTFETSDGTIGIVRDNAARQSIANIREGKEAVGAVAWENVKGRPTKVSSFENDKKYQTDENVSNTLNSTLYAGSSTHGGPATSADKLTTARTISLTGAASGSGSFDGSANSSINVQSLDATKLTGVVPITNLPPSVVERMSVVKDDTERFALTTDSVQDGDVVKVQSSNLMYYVVDDTKLSTEAGYEVFKAGSAASVPWGGVTGKPSSYPPSAHTHTKSQITDFPSSLPNPSNLTMQIEGKNAAVYNGSASQTFNVTKSSLGLDKVNNTADADKSVKYASSAPWIGVTGKPSTFPPSSHTHSKSQITDLGVFGGASATAAGSAGLVPQPAAGDQDKYLSAKGTWESITGKISGTKVTAANSADKLTAARTLTIGNTGKSFDGSANISWSLSEIGALPVNGNAGTVNGHTVNSDVPAGAVFTDHTYSAGDGLVLNGTEFKTRLNNRITIDLSDSKYDQNKWYPVVGTALPYTGLSWLRVACQLNTEAAVTWSSHNNGTFTANLEILTKAGGWGTTNSSTIVLDYSWGWIKDDVCPVSYRQMNNSSAPVFYLRGGGRYYVYASYDAKFTVYTSAYTASGQTVDVQSSCPSIDFNYSTVYANLAGTADAAKNVAWENTNHPATFPPSAHNHDSTYLKLSGGTMTGQLLTSFKNSVATGSYQAAASTVPDLIQEVRYSSGCMGSAKLTTAYNDIPAAWYNFLYIPHRSGGVSGAADNDNCDYGTLLLFGMTTTNQAWIVEFQSSNIVGAFSIRNTDTTYTALKNPNALSITANGKTVTYDGSSAQSISISSGGSKSVASTLLASGWQGSAAPYTYDLGSTYSNKSVIIGYDGTKYSEDSMAAASDADIIGGEGTVIYAYGEKPTVDIPIIIQYS